MTREERAALTRREAQEMIDRYGLNVKRIEAGASRKNI
jgi:hypothetical protein